jgi:hypothetical protein
MFVFCYFIINDNKGDYDYDEKISDVCNSISRWNVRIFVGNNCVGEKNVSVYFKLLQFVIPVYFEHEIHETSLTAQKLYEKDNKKFCHCLFSSADLRRFSSTDFLIYSIFSDFQGLFFESTKERHKQRKNRQKIEKFVFNFF